MTKTSRFLLSLNCVLAVVPIFLFYFGLSHFAIPIPIVLVSPVLWAAIEVVCILGVRPKRYAFWLLTLAPVAFWPDLWMGVLVYGLGTKGI
jgi:hypothetical protein